MVKFAWVPRIRLLREFRAPKHTYDEVQHYGSTKKPNSVGHSLHRAVRRPTTIYSTLLEGVPILGGRATNAITRAVVAERD